MASKSAVQSPSAAAGMPAAADTLPLALAERFAAALLPDEAADFDPARLAEAARFAAAAASVDRKSVV